MARKITLYKFTFEGEAYELPLRKIGYMVKKSETFLRKRMDEDGMTIQEAIEAVPGDPKHRKKRRSPHYARPNNNRQSREEKFAEKNKDLFNKFMTGGLRGKSAI